MHPARAETVKQLVLGKERTIREVTVKSSYAVEFVVGCHKGVSGILDSLKMSRGDISGSSYQCEISHFLIFFNFVVCTDL